MQQLQEREETANDRLKEAEKLLQELQEEKHNLKKENHDLRQGQVCGSCSSADMPGWTPWFSNVAWYMNLPPTAIPLQMMLVVQLEEHGQMMESAAEEQSLAKLKADAQQVGRCDGGSLPQT